VAVSIGLRLVAGDMSFAPGLFVLILAPEVFLPIRNVGAAFHASTAGLEASRDALDLLEGETDAATRPARVVAAATGPTDAAGLRVRDLRVLRDGSPVLEAFDLDAARGEIVAVTGASGSGKSSLVAALLGFADAEGEATLDGVATGAATRVRTAWAGQVPHLLEGTVADNVRLGAADAPVELTARALALASADVPADTAVGPGGSGLSGGQAQRVAVARAIHRLLALDAPLLVLDEPTSALDADREAALAAGLRELADEGRIVLVVTHRDALARRADRVVAIREVAHA
jgi:ABC-type transport system involved in cytochrome bd biosynthesis fused ATPase/permease subunit